jgi:TolB-like protein
MAGISYKTRQEQVRLPSHVIDLAADELRSAAGEQIELRPRSFAVLRLLAENAGRLVCKDEIIAKVWGDVIVTEDSLTQCVADIRKAIADEDHHVLRTVPRRGYLLAASEQQRTAELPGRVPDRPSLAVMPFRPIAKKDATLAIGVASEIINELARNKDLRVVGRDSSFALGSEPALARDLGAQLGVRYLVEGTAQRSNHTLTVDVQLVDARDGSIAWGDRFTAKAKDIPQVQHAIAGKIAANLHSSMRETEKRAILARAPRDLDVFELTLRGIARKHLFTPEALRAGREDLEEALRRDPGYAPAWAYLGWLNLIDIWMQLTGERHPSHLNDVITQFNRAIELEPYLPTAYAALSQAVVMTGDLDQALTLARRSVELGPSDADNLLFLAVTLYERGELEEATQTIDQALDLHPLRPSYYSFFHAIILWANRRYHEALEEAESCLRKAPQFRGAEAWRAIILAGLGRIDEAKVQLQLYLSRPGCVIVPPRYPSFASRCLADLQAAGWRPTVAAAAREAV